MLDHSYWQVIAIIATYFFAATAKGITGLGFSTISLPFLAMAVDVKEALALIIIPSLASNLAVMRQVGEFRQTVARFWTMLLAIIPGLLLGLWVLSVIDGHQAGGILGFILILWCGYSLINADYRLPERLERPLAPISGFLTGVINGITGSQVMPSMPFLMALHLPRNMFIQAINCSFTLSSLIMAVGLGRLNLFTRDVFVISSFGIIFAFLGLKIGGYIRSKLSAEKFRLTLLGLLAIMGVSLILRSFPTL